MIENSDADQIERLNSRIIELLRERDALVKAIRDIKQATIEGRVCDDVAWFDTITTLHDFCDLVLEQVA